MNRSNPAPVDRSQVGLAGRDGLVVTLSRAGELLLLQVQISQLFVVAGRRVLEHDGLELTNAVATPECVVHVTEQSEVGNDLDEDVNQRARRTEEEDHVQPDRLRTATNKVDDRERLQDDAPRIHEGQETHVMKPDRARVYPAGRRRRASATLQARLVLVP